MLELPAAPFHFAFLIHKPGNVLVCFSICPSTVFSSIRLMRETPKSPTCFAFSLLVCKCSTGCLFLRYIINPKGLWSLSPNLLRAIGAVYSGTRARVVTPDGTSQEWDILAGVSQGDTPAPFLFMTVLDYAQRNAIKGRQ